MNQLHWRTMIKNTFDRVEICENEIVDDDSCNRFLW